MPQDAAGDKAFLDHIHHLAGDPASLSTDAGKAVFWSNDFRNDAAGKSYSRNQKEAEELAASGQGYVVIQNLADGITDKMWKKDFTYDGQPVSIGAKTQASGLMSREFASKAHGDVTIYANNTGATSFFRTNEMLTLMDNKDVTAVHYHDTKDVQHTAPKEDWYRWQREEWVHGRIEKLNETDKAWQEQTRQWQQEGDKSKPMPQPNKYAVGDFANEVISSYDNISARKDAAPGTLGYIDPHKEKHYLGELRKELHSVKEHDAALYTRVVDQIRDGLKDKPAERAMFEADFIAHHSLIGIIAHDVATAPQAAVTGIKSAFGGNARSSP
jgi:hypothetical protein